MTISPLMNSQLWLPSLKIHARGRLRLFCFPYAGGGASLFQSWSGLLPPEIEVCPVQLPGREARLSEQAFSRVSELLEALVPILLPHLDEPYAFFGHSMGALICFELTRMLQHRALARPPLRLIVSGRRAPHLPEHRPLTYHLPEEDFIAELRRLKGTPEAVLQDTELLHLLLPLLRADFALCETYAYIPASPLSCTISAIGGLQDSDVPREDVAAWSKQTMATTFRLRFFAGDHFFLHTEQAALLRVLTQDLLSDL